MKPKKVRKNNHHFSVRVDKNKWLAANAVRTFPWPDILNQFFDSMVRVYTEVDTRNGSKGLPQ